MKIGVFGANGFIGSKLVDVLSKQHNIISINRNNYLDYKGTSFDVFINVAGNKFNYWANQFPNKDFKVSTLAVYDSLFDFKTNLYIFMSSIATYDKSSHYGFNKVLSEEIIRRYSENYLIFRCCAVIDKNMEIGIINDVLTGVPLFVSADSQIQFITRDGVANVIKTLLIDNVQNELYNMGGIGAVKISKLEKLIGKPIVYQLGAKKRHYEMDVYELESVTKLKTSYEYVKDIL